MRLRNVLFWGITLAALAFLVACSSNNEQTSLDAAANDILAGNDAIAGSDNGGPDGTSADIGIAPGELGPYSSESTLGDGEEVADLMVLGAAISDVVSDSDFDLIVEDSVNPSFYSAGKSLRDTCKPTRDLKLSERTLKLTFACADQKTEGEINLIRRKIGNDIFAYIQFVDGFRLRGLNIIGSLVMQRLEKDKFDIFPGPKDSNGILNHDGKRDENDRIHLRRFRNKKHRLLKLAFLGALVIHRSSSDIEISFKQSNSNKMGFYYSDKGENDPVTEGDFKPTFSGDFITNTKSSLKFKYPPECLCPTAGEVTFLGKHRLELQYRWTLKGQVPMIFFKPSGKQEGVAFMSRAENFLEIADLDKKTLTAFNDVKTQINTIWQKIKEFDTSFSLEEVTELVNQVKDLAGHCSQNSSISSMNIANIEFKVVCLNLGNDGINFPLGYVADKIDGMLNLLAQNKPDCMNRPPIANAMALQGETFYGLAKNLAPIKAEIDLLQAEIKSNIFDSSNNLLWPGQALNTLCFHNLTKDKEAFEASAAQALLDVFTKKIAEAKACNP